MAGETDLFQKFGRTVEPGKIIFKEDTEGEEMFIIQSGRVKVSRKIGGRDQVLAVLGKGDFFGEMAIVTKTKRTATVVTIDRVELLAFNREGFLNMINKNAKIALHVIDKLCRRLQNANLQIKHLARKDARGLIALNLLYLFQGSEKSAEGWFLDRSVEEISESLDLTLNQVREVLEGMAKAGILHIEGNRLMLKDEGKLDEMAEHIGG